MAKTSFIGGDWGSSRLRLYLFREAGGALAQAPEVREGPGMAQLAESPEATLFGLIDDWLDGQRLPIILSGMVGSNVGWVQAPYLDCPAALACIAGGGVQLRARGLGMTVLPGLRAQNPAGYPDVMRGEELQALGWLALNEAGQAGGARKGRHLLVAPGTHCKWMQVQDGVLETFLTSMTGEVFALLQGQSMLLKGAGAGAAGDAGTQAAEAADGFDLGLDAIAKQGSASLLQMLFTARSRQLAGEITRGQAEGYLSGLLVGADLAGASALLGRRFAEAKAVAIIAEPDLGQRYLLALQKAGKQARLLDPTEVAAAGFREVHRILQGGAQP